MSVYSIAIDGPSGAGKSTLAKEIAARRGIVYVDTGAIYRTIGYYMFENGIDPKDAESVTAALPSIKVDMAYHSDGIQHMFLNGRDVTSEIRLPQISMYASDVSAIPAVRAYLLEMQRDMARRTSVIMDGRDIGTVVLPDADVKIFLVADVHERARRRTRELEQRGTPRPYEQVLQEMEERDWNDTHRATAPLRPAEDAETVDTTKMDFQESLACLLSLIERKLRV